MSIQDYPNREHMSEKQNAFLEDCAANLDKHRRGQKSKPKSKDSGLWPGEKPLLTVNTPVAPRDAPRISNPRNSCVLASRTQNTSLSPVRADTHLSQHAFEPPASDSSPDELAAGRELEQRLRREISELPDQEAAVFCLRYFESMSVAETAATLGVSAGAVSAATLRARKRLAQRMNDVLPTTSSE